MKRLTIDLVAPPFAGHLFPLLAIGVDLRERGYDRVRVLTTSRAEPAVRAAGLSFLPLLSGEEAAVDAIADTSTRVGSNPFRLLGQLRQNLRLMKRLVGDLEAAWAVAPPDLAIVDFVVPLAGVVAQRRGVRWWTSMPTPCALETRTGTPAYVGGWTRPRTALGRVRDAGGRLAVRSFKHAVAFALRRPLAEIGFDGAYRPDGSEAVYSPERILALGLRAFELNDDWPDCMRFVGPLTANPQRSDETSLGSELPTFEPGRRHVLVSLGTHLGWAKGRALQVILEAAQHLPDVVFHFSYGRAFAGQGDPPIEPAPAKNVRCFAFVPYDHAIGRYDAAVIHGGTGVLYACLREGVPMVVWPHDYDQFDHAARIVHHRLGYRCRPTGANLAADLALLFADDAVRGALAKFASLLRASDARARVAELVEELERSLASRT